MSRVRLRLNNFSRNNEDTNNSDHGSTTTTNKIYGREDELGILLNIYERMYRRIDTAAPNKNQRTASITIEEVFTAPIRDEKEDAVDSGSTEKISPVPSLVAIRGEAGSGKSHLLECSQEIWQDRIKKRQQRTDPSIDEKKDGDDNREAVPTRNKKRAVAFADDGHQDLEDPAWWYASGKSQVCQRGACDHGGSGRQGD